MRSTLPARVTRLAAVALAAVLLAACGVRTGSNSTPPITTPPGGGGGPGEPPADRTLIWDQGQWNNNDWA